MEIKLGDFGLATKENFDGERKRTLCGTPNYIAPEVLTKKGHSYEVDIWSIGCILFTLLVGKPPFETQTLKETYKRIRANEYHVPSRVGLQAKNLIRQLLQDDPVKRPSVANILKDDFLTQGYMPSRLPTSCLTMAPRFDTKLQQIKRGPLQEINKEVASTGPQSSAIKKAPSTTNPSQDIYAQCEVLLQDLHKQLASVIATNPSSKLPPNEDELEDPKASPMMWVSKWVDYSDKYGFGYALCDESIGVVFNDLTKLLLLSDGSNIHYIDFDGHEHYYTMQQYPAMLEKKVKLLNYFMNYMKEHLLKAGANMQLREGDELARIPFLRTWFRTSRAVVMFLTNGTLQINFFKDHTKIILCPLMGAVTYINEKREAKTFRLDLIEKFGCGNELSTRLIYTFEKVENMMKSSSRRTATAAE